MFALGIPNTQYRRCTQVLGPERNEPIDYDVEKQNDGFYLFMFPNIDEFEFRDIVTLLKNNGITTIGADEQLTERKIMKLTDLIKEHNLINLTPLKEENFDDRLKAAGGFSDEEMDDITSRDPEMLSISGLMKKNEERTNAVAEAIANSYGIENDSRLKGIIKVALADYI